MKILFFLFTFLYAGLVDIYLKDGKNVFVKEADKILSSPDFWLKRIEDKNVTFGYFEGKKFLIVCNKSKKKVNVYRYDGALTKLDSFNALVGLAGEKKKEGDLRTPIGVYRLTKILNSVDEFYGPFAFVTSYPNYFDRLQNRDGHGIWIHGMQPNREDMNTKGCIALKNSDLEKLKSEIDYKNSYLLISENSLLTATKEDIAKILAFIYNWRGYWQSSDFKDYISLYAKDFKKKGMDLKRFSEYKRVVFNNRKTQNVEIIFKNISIIPYQNIKNQKLFRVDMFEIYNSPYYKFRGKKMLLIDLDRMKIVAEE